MVIRLDGSKTLGNILKFKCISFSHCHSLLFSVDRYIECRCRTIFGFMEVSVRNVFCVAAVFLIGSKFFAIYCECRGIKYMKRSVCKCVFYFFYFLICSFCYNVLVEWCDLVCTIGEAFAPVSIDCCSIKHALYCICVIYTPVHGCGCKCCVRSNGCHINVVSNARNACFFTCCRSTCCICMLADQNTSVRDQGICTFFLKVEACPAVCVFNFHCYGRAYALSSKVEGSVSGNNLCVRECTYITHFAVILCNSAVLDHLIQFQTCYYTGYITCFINICEVVVHVGKSA